MKTENQNNRVINAETNEPLENYKNLPFYDGEIKTKGILPEKAVGGVVYSQLRRAYILMKDAIKITDKNRNDYIHKNTIFNTKNINKKDLIYESEIDQPEVYKILDNQNKVVDSILSDKMLDYVSRKGDVNFIKTGIIFYKNETKYIKENPTDGMDSAGDYVIMERLERL